MCRFPWGPRLAACALAAVLLVATSVPAEAARVLVDFGGTATTRGAAPNDPVNYWNNVSTATGQTVGGTVADLVTTDNESTPIDLVVVARFNGVNTNGTTVSTLYPGNATIDSLYGNTEAFGGLSNVVPSFKLTGLDPAVGYDLTFYASRMSVTDNREAEYTIVGAATTSTTLNAAANINNTASVTGVLPDANGEIAITLTPSANNNNANHFTYLGVLQVDGVPVPEPAGAAALGMAGVLLACRRRRGGRQ